jgi:hypothetical protein
MWCSIINVALLWFAYLVCAFAGGFIYRTHTRWFQFSREAFNIAIYSMLGFYKIVTIACFVVPFVALCIIS